MPDAPHLEHGQDGPQARRRDVMWRSMHIVVLGQTKITYVIGEVGNLATGDDLVAFAGQIADRDVHATELVGGQRERAQPIKEVGERRPGRAGSAPSITPAAGGHTPG